VLPSFSYVRPDTIQEAITHLGRTGAAAHAGGTDLIGCLREGIVHADTVVSLQALEACRGIKKTADGGLAIGALTTITEVAENPMVQQRYPGLARGAFEVASPQLRNQGTIGGNLCQKPRCWYYRGEFHCLRKGGNTCFALEGEHAFHAIFGHDLVCVITHPSDTAPPLAALGATVEISGPGGSRTVPVDRFHVMPVENHQAETVLSQGEMITRIILPKPGKNLYSAYRKVRARQSWDFALAGAALALEMEEGTVKSARVFLSGAAPVPWRSRPVEDAVTGKKLDDSIIRKAAEAVVQEADPLPGNTYKTDLFKGLIEEELHTARRNHE
jgi:xanthine dehydrogenase YagS FAD-binding subunit